MKIANEDVIKIELDNDNYPERIKKILGSKAPKQLYVAGNLALLNLAGIGFCGSRKSGIKGLNIAEDCAKQCAKEEITVISGNATGVDFEAHFNSLKAGGSTIFVIPEGINHFRVKKALQKVWDPSRILVISQFEPNEPWKVYRAMVRNQLIIALSKAIVVIEAGATGGTMNAGKQTLKFGLPLFVVEYENMSTEAQGNKILLDNGAKKLAKNATTDKANLTKIFATIQVQPVFQSPPKQASLL